MAKQKNIFKKVVKKLDTCREIITLIYIGQRRSPPTKGNKMTQIKQRESSKGEKTMVYGLIAIHLFDDFHRHTKRYKEGNYSVWDCTSEACLTQHAEKIKQS